MTTAPPPQAPQRVQLRRTKGWRMPAGATKVDRTTRWGNPYRDGVPLPWEAANAAEAFAGWLQRTVEGRALAQAAREHLRGRDLACWCRIGSPCHGDVLLRVANTLP